MYNFWFPLTEEMQLMKGQVQIQSQVVKPREYTYTPFLMLLCH